MEKNSWIPNLKFKYLPDLHFGKKQKTKTKYKIQNKTLVLIEINIA